MGWSGLADADKNILGLRWDDDAREQLVFILRWCVIGVLGECVAVVAECIVDVLDAKASIQFIGRKQQRALLADFGIPFCFVIGVEVGEQHQLGQIKPRFFELDGADVAFSFGLPCAACYQVQIACNQGNAIAMIIQQHQLENGIHSAAAIVARKRFGGVGS